MSYILDALQRADAERARGGVPTLHARPVTSPTAKVRLHSGQRIGLAIAAVVALGAVAADWWMWRSAPTPVAVAPGAVVPAVQPIAPPVAPVPTQASAPMLQPVTTPVTTPVAAPPQPRTAPIAPPKVPSPTLAASGISAKTPPPTQTEPPAPSPTSNLTPLLSELPEATRRQIPSLAISGAVYSDNPAQRLLLVNGQVLNQGSQVAPDLTLVEIRSNNSEFNFKGTRFRMAH